MIQRRNVVVTIIWTCLNEIPTALGKAVVENEIVDASTLDGKIMAGYQGWFMTPEDGGLNEWRHWSNGHRMPSSDNVLVSTWPDLREFENDELQNTEFYYPSLKNAGLYSSYNEKSVLRHCRWMQEYNIDGVFVQRFVKEAVATRHVRDRVLKNVQKGSERYGRVFANMYDISGHFSSSLYNDIIRDWMHLVDDLLITESPNYLHHDGLPVLSIWGFGFNDRPGNPTNALRLLHWFRSNLTPLKYRATIMGGVPRRWRTQFSEWNVYFRSLDILSPWTVGRIKTMDDVTSFRDFEWKPDMTECNRYNVDYLPVVYPGYSFHNSRDKPFNEVPRLGGTFFWKQLRMTMEAGANMIYVAMFDEVDEGTAVFKIAEDLSQVPTRGNFVRADTDRALGFKCVPSDWYMTLIGNATQYLRAGQPMPVNMPRLSTNCSDNIDIPSTSVIDGIFGFFQNLAVTSISFYIQLSTNILNIVLP